MAQKNGILFRGFTETVKDKAKKDVSDIMTIKGVESTTDFVEFEIMIKVPQSNVKTNFDSSARGAVNTGEVFVPFQTLLGIVSPVPGGTEDPTLTIIKDGAVGKFTLTFAVQDVKVGGPGH